MSLLSLQVLLVLRHYLVVQLRCWSTFRQRQDYCCPGSVTRAGERLVETCCDVVCYFIFWYDCMLLNRHESLILAEACLASPRHAPSPRTGCALRPSQPRHSGSDPLRKMFACDRKHTRGQREPNAAQWKGNHALRSMTEFADTNASFFMLLFLLILKSSSWPRSVHGS